jgi:hypothetical protein
MSLLARAQVHPTFALAVAIVTGSRMPALDRREWDHAIGAVDQEARS